MNTGNSMRGRKRVVKCRRNLLRSVFCCFLQLASDSTKFFGAFFSDMTLRAKSRTAMTIAPCLLYNAFEKAAILLTSPVLRAKQKSDKHFYGMILVINSLILVSSQKAVCSDQNAMMPAFAPPVFNYSNVLQDQIVSHDFRLVNSTTDDLMVAAVQTSCSCTAAHLNNHDQTKIPSHGELTIPVTFQTGKRSGHSESTILVALIDGKGRRYVAQAVMEGNIIPDFEYQPKALGFGTLQPGQTKTQDVTFTSGYLKNFKITGLRLTEGSSEFKIVNKDKSLANPADGSFVITVSVQAPKISQKLPLSGMLEVNTSSSRFPSVNISLSGQVVPDTTISPETLIFASGSPSGQSRVTVCTQYPSHVTGVMAVDADGSTRGISGGKTNFSPYWTLAHTIQITNNLICDAKQIVVELAVRHGADLNETKSVSVKIMRLYD